MWIVIFLGGALLTGYALYRQAVRESGSSFSVVTADIRFGQSGKSVSCHTQLGRI